jgi:hypothetical protein
MSTRSTPTHKQIISLNTSTVVKAAQWAITPIRKSKITVSQPEKTNPDRRIKNESNNE